MTATEGTVAEVYGVGMRWNIRFLGMTIFLLIANCCIYAQEATSSLDSTNSATKVDSLLKQPKLPELIEPSTLAVDSAQLQEFIVEDILDQTRLLPSVTGLDYGSLGQVSPLLVRGSVPQAVNLSIDGFRLLNPLLGYVNSGLVPINLVRRIDLHAARNIVDVRLAEFTDLRPYSRVQYRAGDWGYSDIGITFGLPVQKQTHFLFSGGRQEYDGYFYDTGNGVLNQPRNLVHSRFLARLNKQVSRTFAWRIIALLNKNKHAVPALLAPDYLLSSGTERRQTNRFDLKATAELGTPKDLGSRWQASMTMANIGQKSIASDILFDNRVRTLGLELSYSRRARSNELTLGASFLRNALKSEQLGNRADLISAFQIDDIWQMNPKWQMASSLMTELFNPDAGLAGEQTAESAVRIYPKVKINRVLSEINRVWLEFWQYPRHPSFAERFWPTEAYHGNPALQSARISGAELGFGGEPGPFSWVAIFFANYTDNWLSDGIDLAGTFWGPRNLGKRTVTGIDLKARWQYLSRCHLGFSGNYLFVAQNTPEKQLTVPAYDSYAYLDYGRPFFDNYVFISAYFATRFFGRRWGWLRQSVSALPSVVAREPGMTLNARVNLVFSDVVLTFSYENISNELYEMVPGFYMPPRTFRFSVDWQFWD